MSNADYARRVELLRSVSAGAALLVAGLGALVLLGWGLRFPLLTTFHPAFISMKANTAAGFVLAGLALWLLQSQRAESRAARYAAWAGAALVAGLGVLTLAEYAGGWNLGIDQLLVREPAGALRTVVPGRMAPNTAFSFVLIGLGLLLLEVRTRGGPRPSASWPPWR